MAEGGGGARGRVQGHTLAVRASRRGRDVLYRRDLKLTPATPIERKAFERRPALPILILSLARAADNRERTSGRRQQPKQVAVHVTSAASRKPQGWVTGAVSRGIPRFEVGTPAAANAACNASTSSTRRQQLAMVVFGSIAGRGKNSIWRGPRSRISQPSALAAKTLSWAIAHTVDEIASVKLSANCNPRSLIRGWSDPEPAASSRRARASSQT
jgi:hypothetical protein